MPAARSPPRSTTTRSRSSAAARSPARCRRKAPLRPRRRWRHYPAAPDRSALTALQQGARDRFPLEGERGGRGRLAGAAIPIAGIGGIAFLAMQIGMHPGARLVALLLGTMMCRVPIALGVPPQPLRREPDIGRRLRLRQRLPEAVEVHGGHTACCGQLRSLARCSGNGAIEPAVDVGQKARGAASAAPLNSVAQPHFLRLSAASSACSLTSCAASLTWPLTLSALPSASVCLSPVALPQVSFTAPLALSISPAITYTSFLFSALPAGKPLAVRDCSAWHSAVTRRAGASPQRGSPRL